MPTVMSREEVQAFAHCGDPTCPGNEQQPLLGVREEIGVTFIERGGDLGSIENSTIHLNFADPDLRDCPFCGRDREISEQARVQYTSSGYDPNYLLTEKYAEKLAEKHAKDQPEPTSEPQEDRVGVLEEKFDRLMGAVSNMADAIVAIEERLGVTEDQVTEEPEA